MAEKKPIDWLAVMAGIIGGIILLYIVGTLVGLFVPEAALVAAKIPAMIFLILVGICVYVPFHLIYRMKQGADMHAGELLIIALIIAVVVFALIYIPRLLPDIFKETAFNFKLAVFGG